MQPWLQEKHVDPSSIQEEDMVDLRVKKQRVELKSKVIDEDSEL